MTNYPRKRKRMRGSLGENLQTSQLDPAIEIAHDPSQFLDENDLSQALDDAAKVVDADGVMSADNWRRPSVPNDEADSAVGIAQKICKLSDHGTLERTTSAIPGGDVYGKRRHGLARKRPIPSILGFSLPSEDLMCTLLEEYFDSVHWFSLVVYEPKFRSKFESIRDGLAFPSQKGFLLLLSMVLGMGAWYRSHKISSAEDDPEEDWRGWASSLILGVGALLPDLMEESSIESVQTCTLLGSYYVYHGKPNLSFSLLGATIKTAQAIGLHRQPMRGNFESVEERKRAWWTIYTWDRFASVTYGRPLGINDKDCNVTQPVDVYETPCFKANHAAGPESSICYSAYQRELNQLYLIASPMIETIFDIRFIAPEERVTEQNYITKVTEVTELLWAWRRRLPSQLCLDLESDCEPNYSKMSRVHRLQALSLQLTFDNLIIIFYRPLLAQQVDALIQNEPLNTQNATQSPSSVSYAASCSPLYATGSNCSLSRSHVSSTEQWWDAALRTSKVTEMPQLAQLATDSHLVAFLAINMFNSAIVMAVLALSDPLSDRAQEVKRTITRIFRLQELLGKKTTLSMQSNVVLKDVLQLLLRREAETMFAPVVAPSMPVPEDGVDRQAASGAPLMSVEDTLRLPIQRPLGTGNGQQDSSQHSTNDKAIRLCESLVSVQRAFPSDFEADNFGNIASTEWNLDHGFPGHLSEGSNDTWLHSDIQNFHADSTVQSNEERSTNVTGNGLYWFWDSAWSETRF